jgi:protein SCO1/2
MPANDLPGAKRARWTAWVAAAFLSAAAHAEPAAPVPRPANAARSAVSGPQAGIPDVALLDQRGRRVRFRSDVLRDQVVVIDFVFTTCATVCPLLSSSFARLQQRLGDRLAHGVHLVSISIDPVRDTPERLRTYAARYGAGPAWTWLTGPKNDVERVLSALRAYTPDPSAHTPIILLGDARAGTFARFNGFPAPDRLVARVDELLAARALHASKEGM